MWWHTPVVPATQEAKVGGPPEPREVESAVSCDDSTACQPGQQSLTLYKKNDESWEYYGREFYLKVKN